MLKIFYLYSTYRYESISYIENEFRIDNEHKEIIKSFSLESYFFHRIKYFFLLSLLFHKKTGHHMIQHFITPLFKLNR